MNCRAMCDAMLYIERIGQLSAINLTELMAIIVFCIHSTSFFLPASFLQSEHISIFWMALEFGTNDFGCFNNNNIAISDQINEAKTSFFPNHFVKFILKWKLDLIFLHISFKWLNERKFGFRWFWLLRFYFANLNKMDVCVYMCVGVFLTGFAMKTIRSFCMIFFLSNQIHRNSELSHF